MKLSPLMLLLLLTGFARAQQDVGGFFHLSGGVSLAEGDFASKEPDNEAAGFANNGFTFNALFGHKIHKKFGGFAMLMVSAHRLDHRALSAALNHNAGSYRWNADRGFWSVTGFIFGPQLSHNFKKAAIDFRLGTGALNFISPELVIKGTPVNAGPSAVFTQKQSRASALVLGGGMTVKYEVKWGWVILANADYFTAKPEFKEVEQITEIEGQIPETNYSNFQQEFIMLQLGLGMGYVF